VNNNDLSMDMVKILWIILIKEKFWYLSTTTSDFIMGEDGLEAKTDLEINEQNFYLANPCKRPKF